MRKLTATVGILTSQDLPRLRRLLNIVFDLKALQQLGSDLTIKNVFVNCNTLDEGYLDQALHMVTSEYDVDFIVSSSNGRPGLGKNSSLEVFNRYDTDYLILLDGDDYLYGTALSLLGRALHNNPRLDVLGLQTNDIIDTYAYQGFKGFVLDGMTNEAGVGPLHVCSWGNVQQNFWSLPSHFAKANRHAMLGNNTTPDRIVVYSHRASELLRCSTELEVYEDYVLSIQAQAMHVSGVLNYANISNSYVYIYDKSATTSTCKKYLQKYGGWSFHDEQFKKEIAQYDEVLGDFHAAEVPYIYLPNPYATEEEGMKYKEEWIRSTYNTGRSNK
jgi:hypothetical protein